MLEQRQLANLLFTIISIVRQGQKLNILQHKDKLQITKVTITCTS